MTIRIYETDAYTKEFDATVLSCSECKNGYEVVLDRTAFFPEGGGQQADTGTIGDASVTDVQIKDGVVRHIVDKAFTYNDVVHCAIDWDKRFVRMQNHTGEHLVSGIIHSMFGYDNLGFHMSDNTLTLDPSGILSDEDIKAIELKANKAIYENRAVTVHFPKPQELSTIDYRSKLDLTDGVRLVEIDGYDMCACCAPHVARTGEIGIIKIVDYIQYKGGMRLTMTCGLNAFLDYSKLHDDSKQMMHLLSSPRDKVLEFVTKAHEQLGTQKAEINRLNSELSKAQLQLIRKGDCILGFTKGASFDDMRALINEQLACAPLCAFFSIADNGECSYIIASSSLDVRDTVKALNEKFSGKGGGRPNYAQGKITANAQEISDFFES